MLTNGSPPKTTNMAPTGGLFGSQQRPDDNVGASYSNGGNTRSRETQFWQPANKFHSPPPPPPVYSYLPSQPPFPGAVAEIPDLEISHGSFCRKLRKWRFHFKDHMEGVAAAR